MASAEHVELMKKGPSTWNAWRAANPLVRPDLRDCNFESDIAGGIGPYSSPAEFERFDLSGADLHGVSARNSIFTSCIFDHAELNGADLCFSTFINCTFVGVSMRVSRIGSASFTHCTFDDADLSYCSAEDTSFRRSRIANSSLNNVSFVKADFTEAIISNISVYGISAWDLTLDGCTQEDIAIVDGEEGLLTVDNLEIAQFIHLLIRNSRIREVIDTIASKVVLILGRFTPDRRAVLQELRALLRTRNYVPVLFDFDGPHSRDLTETVRTLAHLSRFVLADLTEPRSIPHELSVIVPSLPSVPVCPILASGHEPFGMFEHFQRFPWVLPVREYDPNHLREFVDSAITDCERAIAAVAKPVRLVP